MVEDGEVKPDWKKSLVRNSICLVLRHLSLAREAVPAGQNSQVQAQFPLSTINFRDKLLLAFTNFLTKDRTGDPIIWNTTTTRMHRTTRRGEDVWHAVPLKILIDERNMVESQPGNSVSGTIESSLGSSSNSDFPYQRSKGFTNFSTDLRNKSTEITHFTSSRFRGEFSVPAFIMGRCIIYRALRQGKFSSDAKGPNGKRQWALTGETNICQISLSEGMSNDLAKNTFNNIKGKKDPGYVYDVIQKLYHEDETSLTEEEHKWLALPKLRIFMANCKEWDMNRNDYTSLFKYSKAIEDDANTLLRHSYRESIKTFTIEKGILTHSMIDSLKYKIREFVAHHPSRSGTVVTQTS